MVCIDGAGASWKVVEKLPSLTTVSEFGSVQKVEGYRSAAFTIIRENFSERPKEMMEIQWVNIVIMIVRYHR